MLLYLLWTGDTWLGASAEEGGWALLIALLLTLPGYALHKLPPVKVEWVDPSLAVEDVLEMVQAGEVSDARD